MIHIHIHLIQSICGAWHTIVRDPGHTLNVNNQFAFGMKSQDVRSTNSHIWMEDDNPS